ncbi:MAG: prenyltransferase/squalene oxidase repeat-containing protein [Planctomycetota bacterium]
MSRDEEIRAEEAGAQEHDEDAARSSRLPAWLTETPYWGVSAVIHVILVLIIGGVVLIQHEEEDRRELTLTRFAEKAKPYDPKEDRHLFEKPEILNPITDAKPVVADPTVVEPPDGDPDHMAETLDYESVVSDIGLNGGGPSGRNGIPGRDPGRPQGSGGPGAESAVRAALEWLRRHQHPDGHWASNEYYRKNTDEPYKLVKYEGYSDGTGFDGFDVGVTSLAMLAFLGFGETHQTGRYPEYRDVMKRATKWLVKQQVKKGPPEIQGRFGKAEPEEWIYNHALATMAMSELLLMTRDFRLKHSVEKATRFSLGAQNEGYGWRYGYKPARNDTSVTGWMVLALKTSRQCARQNLISLDPSDFKESFAGALAWMRTSTARSGRTGYMSPGDPGSSLMKAYDDPYPFSKDLSCMTAVSVLCRLFAGESSRSKDIKAGIGILSEQLPEWRPARKKRKSKINMYYWYYATYALFQHGGTPWRDWNKAMLQALIPTQIQGGDEDGSWDPIGEWGTAGGRVYATAINAMTLEVYYRFARATDETDEYGSTR